VARTADLVPHTVLQLLRLGITRKSRVLLAVSGGIDSMSLLHLLSKERERFAELALAHVNHHLRGEESDADEAFVRSECEKLLLPLHVSHANTAELANAERQGIEETAREERYKFFEQASAEHGYDIIVTAHTKNDQAETLMMRLMRGAGPRGLAGIPASRKLGKAKIIRPWLDVTREEIEGYAGQHNVAYRTDSSNAQKHYTRNRVRHELLPLMEEIGGIGVVDRLAETASLYREKHDRIRAEAEKLASTRLIQRRNHHELDVSGYENIHDEVLHQLLELSLLRVLDERYYLEREPFDRLKQFISEGGEQDWGEKLRLRSTDGKLGIKLKTSELPYEYPLVIGDRIMTPFGAITARILTDRAPVDTPNVSHFDLAALTGELFIRNWREGETTSPFGMEGKKNISKLLTDAKLSAWQGKSVYPVLVMRDGGEDVVLSVPGIRRSNLALIDSHTSEVLEVTFEPFDR
jgi:tRNA(Ile)-lysidine synthase